MIKKDTPPGSLVYIGDQSTDSSSLHIIEYDLETCSNNETKIDQVNFDPESSGTTVKWIRLIGLQDTSLVENLGKRAGIHPLFLEDILNTTQRSKFESSDEKFNLLLLKLPTWDDEKDAVSIEQISLFFVNNVVITFHESEQVIWQLLEKRIQEGRGRVRQRGSDYLVYAILDLIIDCYAAVVSHMHVQIDLLEEKIIGSALESPLENILWLKRQAILLRNTILPIRDVIGLLRAGGPSFFSQMNPIYLNDITDHILQILDSLEVARENLVTLQDLHLANVSYKMNEVIKVLTIFSTIFMPMTFITSIYGMNFAFMPELNWRWGYPIILGVSLMIGIGMWLYFKRKHWV